MKAQNPKLLEKAVKETRLDVDLILLAITASILASVGIYFGSDYWLMGSVLISPVFASLLSTVYFLKSKRYGLMLKGLKVTSLVMVVIFVVSLLVMWILKNEYKFPPASSGLLFTKEIIMLLSITIGMMGMLFWHRETQAGVVSGIILSIALLRPLVEIASGVIFDDTIRLGANILVLIINLLGIILGAWMVLLLRRLFKKTVQKSISSL